MTILRILSRAVSSVAKTVIKNSDMNSFVWIDLEMTGLDVTKDTILEAACIITDTDLNPVHKGIHVVINHPEEVLSSMNSWSAVHHAKTGLTSECRKSKISLLEAEQLLSEYIKLYTDSKGVRYIAGNSVYMDKLFLEKYMPSVNNILHYRLIDVSALKVICQHWYPEQFSKLEPKQLKHRALDDILESIEELKKYKEVFFKEDHSPKYFYPDQADASPRNFHFTLEGITERMHPWINL